MSEASNKSLPGAKRPRKTTTGSKKGKATGKSKSRPFSAETWNAARQVAADYQIIVSQEDEQWYGRGLEMPTVFGDGATVEECFEQTREALAVAVAYLLEQGKSPIGPARQGLRTQQVNVRLTSEEKALLESVARGKGYQGLSDFIRAVALESVR